MVRKILYGTAMAALLVGMGQTGWAQSHPPVQPKANLALAETTLSSDRLIGATVRNSKNEVVGKIDSLLMSKDYKVQAAVVEVGGFLGIGAKAVALPITDFVVAGDKVMLPSATKEHLSAAPAYERRTAANEVADLTARTRADIDRTAGEWQAKISQFNRNAKDKTEAGYAKTKAKLDAAWNGVETEWSKVKAATKDGWNDAEASFDKAISELERVWQEVSG